MFFKIATLSLCELDFRTPEYNAYLTALRRLNPHVASWKTVSCEKQLDLFVSEHDKRNVTDGVRTPWKLFLNVTLKHHVCLSSACPEVPVESCFFDDPILFEAITMFQLRACVWCCNTKTNVNSVLLTASLVWCPVFLFVTSS